MKRLLAVLAFGIIAVACQRAEEPAPETVVTTTTAPIPAEPTTIATATAPVAPDTAAPTTVPTTTTAAPPRTTPRRQPPQQTAPPPRQAPQREVAAPAPPAATPQPPQETPAPPAQPARSAADASAGSAVFKSKCAACHGGDGSGNTAMGKKFGVRDLGSSAVQSQSDAELANIIRNGKGPQSEKAHKSRNLTDDQLRDVIAFIRSL